MEMQTSKVHFSWPSIIALVTAVASIFTGAFLGFVLAMIAIICGVFGALLSLAPSIRGGLVSILSLVLAAIGVVIAVFRAIEQML
jgi:membrane protein implicated in regulation of membrane protease activity